MILLTQEEVRKVRRVSTTFDQERFEAFAREAQDTHLRMFLGDSLYLDLLNNSSSASYTTLLNGEDYTKDGETVRFFGLYTFLSYAWLFINAVEGNEFQSNSGTVNFTDTANFKIPKSNSGKKYQDSMIIYRNNAIDYLNEKQSIYPLWKGNNKEKRGSFRMISL